MTPSIIQYREHKFTRTKTVLHPTLRHVYATYRRVPKNLLFRSDLVSDENQDLCHGWFPPGRKLGDDSEIQQVIRRRKPFGCTWGSEDRIQHIVEQARAAGLHVNLCEARHPQGDPCVEFCLPGRLRELFDLESLAGDYARELPGMVRPGEIFAHGKNELTSYFGDQWDCPPQPLWLTGLILGYPVENTIADYRR